MSRLVVAMLAAALSLSLVACATTTDSADTSSTSGSSTAAAPSDSTSSPNTTSNTAPGCNADGARSVVGQTASAEVIEQARIAAGADSVRTIKPGEAVTMEYLTGRLNVDVDASNSVTNVRCG